MGRPRKLSNVGTYGDLDGKSRAANLAAQFRTQATAVVEKDWRALVDLPIPTIAKDFVFRFVAQRVDFTSMLYGGLLPESFARSILDRRERAQNNKDFEDDFEKNADYEEKKGALEFQLKIAQLVCCEPKLVMRPAENEEEYDISDLPFSGDLIVALFNYAMGASPGVPVETTKGETTLKAVETFRESEPGAEPTSSSANGA